MTVEARICFVPFQPVPWRPEPPSAASWRFLREQCNVTGVRLQYLYSDARWWPDAFAGALDGGMQIHGNFCAPDDGMNPITQSQIEESAFVWMMRWGKQMTSVSFGNEPGYTFGDDDISKVGSRDYMQEYVDNFWLPFIRGVRRANPSITIGGPDAESADTLQRFVNLVDVNQWFVHPYGEREVSDGEGLHYARMTGSNSEPGFVDISISRFSVTDDRARRPLIISEINHQEMGSAKKRRDDTIAECLAKGMTQAAAEDAGRTARSIATDEEVDRLTTFSVRMRDELHAPVVTFESAEVFFTRKPAPDPWSTFTHGTPEMSESGKRLAAVFAPVIPAIPTPRQGRTPGRRG